MTQRNGEAGWSLMSVIIIKTIMIIMLIIMIIIIIMIAEEKLTKWAKQCLAN